MGNKTKIIIVIVIIVIVAIAINSFLGNNNNSATTIELGSNKMTIPANWTDEGLLNDSAGFSKENSKMGIYVFDREYYASNEKVKELFDSQVHSNDYYNESFIFNGTTVYYLSTMREHPSNSYVYDFKYVYLFKKNNEIYRITIIASDLDTANKNNNYKNDVISIINSIK